jgi:AraC-like DNA-binding protein
VLDRYASDLLARLPASTSHTDRVRQVVAQVLREGPTTLGDIARSMHASPRTVQRWLRGEGTTFRRIVDDVRRELALFYLDSPDLSVTEIAFLLGFTEPSGFRRTHQRWTGMSPVRSRTK